MVHFVFFSSFRLMFTVPLNVVLLSFIHGIFFPVQQLYMQPKIKTGTMMTRYISQTSTTA